MPTAISPGDLLLHYRVVRKLGEGGMGVVLEAEDTRLGRTVAIKLLQHSISNHPDSRARFLREARAASALDHPNLCTIYTVEEAPDGALLLVMACYRGETLAELLAKRGALETDRIRDIGRQIATGLHAAHMAGIVHRDIKPGNIFLVQSGGVRILDFGLSRIAHETRLTAPHEILGTLAYMSPEQLAGETVDHRTDIWSLGAVLYEMAAGHPPFRHATPGATCGAISRADYLSLHQARPGLPEPLVTAVHRCLRVHPHERHSSAAEIVHLLSLEVEPQAPAKAAPAVLSDATADIGPGVLRVEPPSARSSVSPSGASRGVMFESDAGTEPSIAVLPLRNLSSEPDSEYFGDGLTEELISSLGTIPGLRVVSRTSAFAFKGATKDIREIGEALHAKVILEGSVRRAGTRVRVHTQLIHVRRGFQLWSARFDRELSDVFELQDEIASSVVSALRDTVAKHLSLAGPEPAMPMSTEAYEAYLKGRYHWNRKTIEDIQLAGRYFERALQIDENSAAAHAGVADFYCLQATLGMMPPHEAWGMARSSALKAISLDPNLPEGHIALAAVMEYYDWNWDQARQHLMKAIELRPQRGESYYLYAACLMIHGLLDEALEQVRIGLSYDPLSAPLLGAEAIFRAYLGDHDAGILLAQSALQSAPHYFELYYALGTAQILSGRTQDAVRTFEEGLAATRMPVLLGCLADAHVQNGDREKARLALDQLLEYEKNGTVLPVAIALAAAALGDHDLAFAWLEKAAERRDIFLASITTFPSLKPLHDDPRYHRLLQKMNLKHPSTHRSRHAAR